MQIRIMYITSEVIPATMINMLFFLLTKTACCRISRDGGKITILDPDPCIYASLIGNYIYYLHYDSTDASTELYKVKIDGSEKEKLMGGYAFTCNSNGQYFYYNSPDDGKLYQFDTKTDTSSLYYDCSCYKPIVTENNDIYYMDVSQDNAIVHSQFKQFNACDIDRRKYRIIQCIWQLHILSAKRR